MNKGDLTSSVASAAGISKAQAADAVNAVFDSIKSTLADGGTVSIAGFGSFVVRDRKARTGRNPKTGEPLQIPASKAAAFKAGKALKDAVN